MAKADTRVKKITTRNKNLPVVAIGGSAGGMEAFLDLLKELPPQTGMAYVYIQHLSQNEKSFLDEIIGRGTKMKVQVVKDRMKLEPDQIYIIPPSKDIILANGTFKLIAREGKSSAHLPIDRFFISLADNATITPIAIVLSGNSSDGTLGLKAIKLAGGITLAQDETAKFQTMPKAAIFAGTVDRVLSPKEIAEELVRFSSKKNDLVYAITESSKEDVPVEELDSIIQILRKSTGVDFKHYKMNTIKRRILRRMLLYKHETLKEYVAYLRSNQSEISSLYQDILINVTSFFRDPDALEYLRKTLLPKILQNKAPNEPVRIWIPACSTGEEAYTLAIILIELLNEKATNFPIQIFATDLSELAIAKARLGVYAKHELLDVSPKQLQRFFTKVDGSYRIAKGIRDLCVFAPHNVFRDPPFSRIDLISCCNLMIYLDAVLQKKLIATFHYSLVNNGYLVLGKSETIGASAQLFSQLEKKYKIYVRKNDNALKAKFEMNYRPGNGNGNESSTAATRVQVQAKSDGFDKNLEQTVSEILLSRYVPASVVINQDLEILQFRGSTGLFLEPSPGKASLNLLKMVRTGLAFELRSIIHKSSKSGKVEKKSGLEVKYNGTIFKAAVEVEPLPSDGEEKLFLVVFEKLTDGLVAEGKPGVSKDKLVKQLQHELDSLKEDMRSILEEQEASLEELQSANEEIVSSNEELQSINEELETSKEEVESTNEELMTINKELQVRNEQLAESYEYSEAVFDTIREAVLVLDMDFRVRSANEAFYRIFRANEEETVGRIIYELGNRQWDIHKLRQLLEEIIPKNSTFNGFEVQHEFPEIGKKIILLNAKRIMQKAHNKHLILLAMEDITDHRQAEKIMAEREIWFRNMADNAPVMIWVSGLDKKRNFFNKTWIDFTGQDLRKENMDSWKAAIHKDDIEAYMNLYEICFLARKTFQAEYRLRRSDGEYRWTMDIAKPTYSAYGAFLGYIGSCTEIHDKKLLHDELEKRVATRTNELEEINKELQRSNRDLQQFAYVASHDLQEPLRKIMTFADRMDAFREQFPEQGKLYLEKITESSKRMARLIGDLLNYSRISREGKFQTTDLNKIIKEVLLDFEVIIKEKNAIINIRKLPSFEAIPLQMEQLFHNLFSNAFKFSRDNVAPEINITYRNLPQEEAVKRKELDPSAEYFEIIFKDNGIGFPLEFAQQIFVIFQRLNDRKHYPGTGIGLALCEKIVQNHDGEIFALSGEFKGAEFHVILPFKHVRKATD
jgi:two-component system, chemotaxis family, CheB/CheR fusion protein